jgi:hypothetical protein
METTCRDRLAWGQQRLTRSTLARWVAMRASTSTILGDVPRLTERDTRAELGHTFSTVDANAAMAPGA